MRIRAILLLAVFELACEQSEAARRPVGTDPVEALVGAWDASMTLTQPYPLELRDPAQRSICGAIGFIANRDGETDGEKTRPGLLGVFDLDLRALGLRWIGDTSAPLASATAAPKTAASTRVAGDSLTITLEGSDKEAIVLRGDYEQDEIRGAWTARSSRGTASGAFTLKRHGRQQSVAC